MPTYDYQCDACGHEWEMFQSMTENPIKKCPECGKRKAQRLIGAGAGVIFKGDGFYETDYRSESYKKGADAAKKAAEPKSDSKSESKSSDASSGAKSKSAGSSSSSTD